MKTITRQNYSAFGFHLVTPSPWPIFLSFTLFGLAIGTVMSLHGYKNGEILLQLAFLLTLLGMSNWFIDITSEATLLGDHTKVVKSGLVLGIVLFIISELFAFLSIFWAFLHASLSPAIEIGLSWPPQGITSLNAFGVPLLNTGLLLSSGASVTYAHHALIKGDRKGTLIANIVTVILAILFTALQYLEYSEATFTISDAVYGSVFYCSTGLHGLN